MKKIICYICIICSIFSLLNLYAQEGNSTDQPVIVKIDIEGNNITSDAAILAEIKTRPFQPYNERVINEDIKRLYQLGAFETISVDKKDTPEGLVVVFKVKEKPIISDFKVEGSQKIHSRRLEKEIDIKKGEYLDEYRLKENVEKIKQLYYKKGFSECQVDYEITADLKDKNKVIVVFNVKENKQQRIDKIIIKGNETFSAKKIVKLMRTKPKGWFRRGIFKEETLEDDLKRIKDFYLMQGFNDVVVQYSAEKINGKFYIVITINEGQRYYIGRVKTEGNKQFSQEELLKVLELKEGDFYVEKKVQDAVNKIRGVYIDKGYIYAQVKPIVFLNPQTQKIDITFNIEENQIAYVEKIDIRGNVKTQDKVIRRELRIYPGDKFEGEKIRLSRQRLDNLGFFEEIRFDSEPGNKPNWEKLIVEVKEAKTGYFSFGGGYSSIDEFTGFIELRQRNFDFRNWKTFTGAGQDLSILASFGSLTKQYQLSFVNPWIFDRPISFGFEAYRKGHLREEDVGYGYEEDVKGGAFRLGKEFNDFLKAGIGYRFESVEITDVAEDASQALKDEAGKTNISSIEIDFKYDKRDNIFSPHQGWFISNYLQIAGLGADKDFIRTTISSAVYYPLIKKSVLELRTKIGFAETFSGTDKLPIYKRFFAGGASTIRGYHERKIGPIDPVTEDPIGGEAMFVGNIEYTYPLVDVLKVACFFDVGNVWEKNSDFMSGGLKSSVGMGIRVKTPLGPISLDYGWPLNKEPGEEGKNGRFHFSISRGF